MAAKLYYRWDDGGRRWVSDWSAVSSVATRGALAHEVRQGYDGKHYVFTRGARPKRTPDAPAVATLTPKRREAVELAFTSIRKESTGFPDTDHPFTAACEGNKDYSGDDFRKWLERTLRTTLTTRSGNWTTQLKSLTDAQLAKANTARIAQLTKKGKAAPSKTTSRIGYASVANEATFPKVNLTPSNIWAEGDKEIVRLAEELAAAYNRRWSHGFTSKATRVIVDGEPVVPTYGGPIHRVVVDLKSEPTPEEKRLSQHKDMMARFTRVGFGSAEARHALSSAVLGRKVTTNRIAALTDEDRARIIAKLDTLEG